MPIEWQWFGLIVLCLLAFEGIVGTIESMFKQSQVIKIKLDR
jgi:hypothetical protein